MNRFLIALILSLFLVNQGFAQCATGGAVWLNGENDGVYRDTGLLGGHVLVEAATSGTMSSGRPYYRVGSSFWKGFNYASLQVWRAYSSPGSNRTYFKLSQPLDSNFFHVRVDNIRGDFFNWESQNVRGYLNGAEVPADFKDPVNGATASGNTISGGGGTSSAVQSAMRVMFHGPVDSIVVRQTSVSDWIIAELQIQCNILLPVSLQEWFASRAGQAINLGWSLAEQQQIHSFTLEYSSNGRAYSELANISVRSDSRYRYTDQTAGSATRYYRLRINYRSGASDYSTVKVVRASTVWGMRIYPNPASSFIQIDLPNTITQVQVRNTEGRLVLHVSARGTLRIDVAAWPSGVYMVTAQAAGQTTVSKLIVQ